MPENIPNPDSEVDFQIGEGDQETTIEITEDENGEATQAVVQESSAEGASGSKEHEEYGQRVRKRLDKLTAKLREAERREQAAIEYAKSVQQHLTVAQQRAQTLDQSYLTESEGRISSQMAIVEANMQDAVERGDGKAAVEAQKLMSKLILQREQLSAAKSRKPASQTYVPPPPPEITQPIQRVDPKAETWAEENEWFGEDVAMTNAAYGIHNQLSQEGFDLSSDEYYDELNRRIRKAFPHKFRKQADMNVNVPNVAPATRGSTVTGGRRSVKLTPSMVAMARRLGVPVEEYAKYVKGE
jgi:hypothetical protein